MSTVEPAAYDALSASYRVVVPGRETRYITVPWPGTEALTVPAVVDVPCSTGP